MWLNSFTTESLIFISLFLKWVSYCALHSHWCIRYCGQSQRQCVVRHELSSLAWTLGWWVQTSLKAWTANDRRNLCQHMGLLFFLSCQTVPVLRILYALNSLCLELPVSESVTHKNVYIVYAPIHFWQNTISFGQHENPLSTGHVPLLLASISYPLPNM